MHNPPLQPLRVPQNWAISHNTFFELDPSETNRAFLCEDLFQAMCVSTNVLVDLGWYPDGDPTGHFVVQAFEGDFRGRELLRVNAKTRAEAVLELEAALWRFHYASP